MKLVVLMLILAVIESCSSVPDGKIILIKKHGTLGDIVAGCDRPATDWKVLWDLNPQLPSPVEVYPGVHDVWLDPNNQIGIPGDWNCQKLDPRFALELSRDI